MGPAYAPRSRRRFRGSTCPFLVQVLAPNRYHIQVEVHVAGFGNGRRLGTPSRIAGRVGPPGSDWSTTSGSPPMRNSRIPRLAALALGLGLLTAGAIVAPAALAVGLPADDVPDLAISQTTSVTWSGSSIQDPGGPVTYWLTVKNPSIQVWDAELHRYYTGGAPAYGVVVRDTLPTGSQFVSASGDGGFGCSQASGVVTCSGGTLLNGGTAPCALTTHAPGVMGQYTNTAIVDPNNPIVERKEGNNTTSLALTVVYLN
jgi:hypothetical protein